MGLLFAPKFMATKKRGVRFPPRQSRSNIQISPLHSFSHSYVQEKGVSGEQRTFN